VRQAGRSLLVLAIVLTFLASGCQTWQGAPAAPPPDLPPRNPDLPKERVDLEVWLYLDFWVQDTLFREIVRDFEETYPNVKVHVQAFVPESMVSRVRQASQFGDPPDLAQGHVFAMAAQGFAEPIDDLWQKWGAESEFLPIGMEEVTWQGKRYGVPMEVYCLALLYNKDLFDLAGRPYPGELYEAYRFQEDLAALSAADGSRYGLGLSTDPWYAFGWLAANGGEVLAQNPAALAPGSGQPLVWTGSYTVTLNSPRNIAALQFIADLTYNKHYGPLPTSRPRDYEDARKRFVEGRVAMFFGVPWDVAYIKNNAPNIRLGVAPMPVPDSASPHISVRGSSGFFIPRGARNKLVAFEFMKWATSDHYARQLTSRLGRYPAKAWLYDEAPGFSTSAMPYRAQAGSAQSPVPGAVEQPFFAQLQTAQPYRLDAFPDVERAFVNAIKSVFYGADARQALDRAQQEAEASLRKSAAP
jgi:ABC-type glycerol-3-phosphate transport system substrate-binding protein